MITCRTCEGKGINYQPEKEEIKLFLKNVEQDLTFGEKKEMIKVWKKTGYIPCVTCSGRGKIAW